MKKSHWLLCALGIFLAVGIYYYVDSYIDRHTIENKDITNININSNRQNIKFDFNNSDVALEVSTYCGGYCCLDYWFQVPEDFTVLVGNRYLDTKVKRHYKDAICGAKDDDLVKSEVLYEVNAIDIEYYDYEDKMNKKFTFYSCAKISLYYNSYCNEYFRDLIRVQKID